MKSGAMCERRIVTKLSCEDFAPLERNQTLRQVPLNSAPSSMIIAGAETFPVTLAVRPSTSSLLAMISPSTVPFILATATLITAWVTSAPALTMSVPSEELTFPEKCPSMRSIDLKRTSPVNLETSPTKPSQLSFGVFAFGLRSLLVEVA